MFKVVTINWSGDQELEKLLNEGWRIHDKTATHDYVIYILYKSSSPSGANA